MIHFHKLPNYCLYGFGYKHFRLANSPYLFVPPESGQTHNRWVSSHKEAPYHPWELPARTLQREQPDQ